MNHLFFQVLCLPPEGERGERERERGRERREGERERERGGEGGREEQEMKSIHCSMKTLFLRFHCPRLPPPPWHTFLDEPALVVWVEEHLGHLISSLVVLERLVLYSIIVTLGGGGGGGREGERESERGWKEMREVGEEGGEGGERNEACGSQLL